VPLLLLFCVYAVTSVGGLILLKAWLPGAMEAFLDGRWLAPELAFAVAGATLYVISFACWLAILIRAPLSWAFPLAFGITALGSSLAGAAMFGEGFTMLRTAGTLTILAGVTLLGLETS